MMGRVKKTMATEIELKLLFQESNKKSIINLFDNLKQTKAKPLVFIKNQYFDTPNLQLRCWDMGLRIREVNGRLEQTIKTAGTVVGGVHSRPEYNIDIQQTFPDLTLFPNTIWPNNIQIDFVNEALQCLFSTDFSRQCWHVCLNQSVIEVALDLGSIYVGEFNESICELEFELISGEQSDLLVLANMLVTKVPVRLGQASKAKRGYLLAAKAGIIIQENNVSPEIGTLLSALQERVNLLANEKDDAHKSQQVSICLNLGLECWLHWEEKLLNSLLLERLSLYDAFQRNVGLLQQILTESVCDTIDNISIFKDVINEVQRLIKNDASLLNGVEQAVLTTSLFNSFDYGRLQVLLVGRVLSSQ